MARVKKTEKISLRLEEELRVFVRERGTQGHKSDASVIRELLWEARARLRGPVTALAS